MPKKPLDQCSSDDIKELVKEKYSEVATKPSGKYCFPVGRAFAESVGYPKAVLDQLHESFWEAFTGAGNPQPYADPKVGEHVLDLGCGAGLDLYFYDIKISDQGKLYGLDISETMLEKAKQNMQSQNIHHVQFLLASSDDIPLPDESLDLVTANGIYNLSPDKIKVMKEVYRVLKTGGRTIFSEIMLKAALPEKIQNNPDDWFRCIGGAMTKDAFVAAMKTIGFKKIETLWQGKNARTGHKLAICNVIRAEK